MVKQWVLVGLGLSLFSSGKVLAAKEFDNGATVFQGAYRLSETGCRELFDGGYERAYVKVGKDALGAKEVSISFYGDDARIDSILLEKGSRKPLGVSAGSAAVETWEATLKSEVHLISKKTTKSQRNSFTQVQELEIPKNQVNVRYRNTEANSQLVCDLEPTLSKKQRAEVCKHILIARPELKAQLTEASCLKNGTFKIETNDAGQLGLNYTNVTLKQDETLTCEVNFDKPLGQFAPAVESCEFN